MRAFQHEAKRGRLGLGILAVALLVFCGLMLTGLLGVAIWPGELKLTAPLLCPDGKTDAYIVIDSSQFPPNRTSYDLSLYCVGPRGNFENAGFAAPFFLLSAFHTGLLCIAAMLFLLPAALRRRRAKGS